MADTTKYSFLFLLLTVKCEHQANMPIYQRLAFRQEHVINANTVCGNTPGLTTAQLQLCSRSPHSVASAIQGVQVAIHECKEQFNGNRWNCSALETKNKLPQSSTFLKHASGNKESAFSHAIASAGVVHQVAHACSLGKIEECVCPQYQPSHLTASQRKQFHKSIGRAKSDVVASVQAFERVGCNHNINYGMEFAVMFLDSNSEHDIVSQIRSHNNRVGRLIVSNNMKQNCRCHGTSGSCSQRTCWRETPDFNAVGLAMKDKYRRAIKVSPRVFGNRARTTNVVGQRLELIRDSFTVEDLIYMEDSPSYCAPNRRMNVSGTRGRFCDPVAGPEKADSCENLCCSRGYTTRTVRRTEQCRCRFHWCCYVDCDRCEWQETVSVCN